MIPKHLGGSQGRDWHDLGALSYMYNALGVRSIIDIGCGLGQQVKNARNIGMKATGVDGDPTVMADHTIDFTQGSLIIPDTDLAWSIEFLEHVPIQFTDNYMRVFSRCKYIVCTANMLTANSRRHYNLKGPEYWVNLFKKYGYEYNGRMYRNVLGHSTMKPNYKNVTWLMESGMCFHKKGKNPYGSEREDVFK